MALVNLSVVALLGSTLRSKILFPLPFIDQKHVINAHSHFAFGGWVTLSLFILFIYNVLPREVQGRKAYQYALWGILLNSWGMVLSFPFLGYTAVPIIFSTLFIFVTYYFAWFFIGDVRRSALPLPVRLLAIASVVCLVISSTGPFTLAYELASGSANSILYRDSIYTYLHFQYNGFFTLGVFALFLNHLLQRHKPADTPNLRRFATCLTASVVPSLFLSLLWHPNLLIIKPLAILGVVLIVLTLFFFFRSIRFHTGRQAYARTLATLFWHFSMLSFVIKMVLQVGTVIPQLGQEVFGYRPIIIGFLHLVFLGFVTFYILSVYFEEGIFNKTSAFAKLALSVFAFGIITQEVILMTQGILLFLGSAPHIYHWLLWIIALVLFTGAVMVAISAIRYPGPAQSQQLAMESRQTA